jgi:RimJ/RimL family protein N-acetyltransferase
MEKFSCPAPDDRATRMQVKDATAVPAGHWRDGLPTLEGSLVTLRELQPSDAGLLFNAITTDHVTRFLSPPPPNVDGFQRFICWAHEQRAAGRHICYAAVTPQSERVVGLFQIRSLDLQFATAEWGFALAPAYWGTGIFVAGAKLALDFAFDVLGAYRLEARAVVANGRGNGALQKLGATHEARLRRSFFRNGEYLDQALWSIMAEEWHSKASWESRISH